MTSQIIGIDLGTTSSRVAVIRDGAPVIIENAEGEGTTPSHVAITATGQRLVGKAARRYALKDPANVVFAVKRIIGRSFEDPVVQEIRKFMPYAITRATNGDAWVRVQGRDYAPEQISAFTLQKMKQTAEAYLGQPVTNAIITVPAYFNDSQRQATKNAARIAGLEVLRLYAEPTVAALAYGFGKEVEETIAVYDLGGGTFDISILDTRDGVFEVRSTCGDMFLGGEDFDLRLVNHIASEYQKSTGISLLEDAIARQRLKEAAEIAKITLSSESSAEIDLPFIATGDAGAKHLNMVITRSLFEDLIRSLTKRSVEVCQNALNDAGLRVEDIDQVVLVGGSTRIPLVKNSLQRFFGKTPHGGIRREDSVALGAAVYAGVLTGEVKGPLLLDALPISIGIETFGGVFTKIIERNTTIPTRKSEIFSTATDNQTSIQVHVLQGEHAMAVDNRTLGKFHLFGIPPAPHGKPQIEVTFGIDANATLDVSARDLDTGKEQNFYFEASGGLSDEGINKLYEAAQEPAEPKAKGTEGNIITTGMISASLPSFQGTQLTDSDLPKPLNIFISYAHEDAEWARIIQKSLSIVARKNSSKIWIDRMLRTGDYWEEQIYSEIEQATVAILLISPDFLNSEFILKNELPRIFAEKERRYLWVFPVMARSCPYELHEELSKFQFFNNPERPLKELPEWEIDKELTRLARELASQR